MNGSLIILIALFVIVAGVIYLAIERQSRQYQPPSEPTEREWNVQCPNCLRWKEMTPFESDQGDFTHEDGGVALQPDGKYRFHNHYKCPFCGHRWEEEYLE
ncbi:MAG: hypothetical protein AAF614_33135 [Chloroflexota bacterium]